MENVPFESSDAVDQQLGESTIEIVKNEKLKEPFHRNVDDDTLFWQVYLSETNKFDKELLDNWNETLNSLLLFATLFSAINTAFIIEAYKGLRPDNAETTNTLLKLVVDRLYDNANDYRKAIGEVPWQPSGEVVRVNSTFFVSLACSLLASFGAILGKEMLSEYKNSGALSTLPEQGRIRQRKYNGLKRFRFRLLMQLLPALLQLSLALFLIGIIDFMWQINFAIAAVVMVPVTVGLLAYCLSLIIALKHPDSPFQTSISKSFRLLLPKGKRALQALMVSILKLWEQAPSLKTFPQLDPWIRSVMCQMGHIRRLMKRVKEHFRALRVGQSLECSLSRIVAPIKQGIVGLKSLRRSRAITTMETAEIHRVPMERNNISTDCVVWLLEKAQNAEVIRKALETVPLLPPDMLLKRFRSKKKILERYVPMYNSSLHRRAGDVEFRLDDTRTQDAIVAGTALFHVLKSRQEEEYGTIHIDQFGGDPDLFDWIGDPEKEGNLDFALLTVILCVQSQMGVDTWDVDFLIRLLKRFYSMINTSQPQPGPGLSPPFSLSSPSITLLLDVAIYCATRRHYLLESSSVLEHCSQQFEEILDIVHTILDAHPTSMTLTSHVALVVAVVQWYRMKDLQYPSTPGSVNKHDFLELEGVKADVLRSSWLTIDKRSEFFSNIALISSTLSSPAADSPLTRRAIAEVVGWMIQCPDAEANLPSLVEIANGMYQQSIHMPTLLLSVMMDRDACSNLKEFCEHHLNLLLVMDAPRGSVASKVQLEALLLVLPNLRKCYSTYFWRKLALRGVQTLLTRLGRQNNMEWPGSFLEAGIVEWSDAESSGSSRRMLQLIDNRWKLVEQDILPLWCGKAIVLVWHTLLRVQDIDTGTLALVFGQDSVAMVLECFKRAVEANCEISTSTVDIFLEAAIDFGNPGVPLIDKIGEVREQLAFAKAHGWEALYIDTMVTRSSAATEDQAEASTSKASSSAVALVGTGSEE
ncbi:hypothetical protein FRC03_003488 [Tulasnella sp. 419]|nr:hypothetical protein FRC03_003488 [Tulasnella sp. 419]